MHWHLQDNSSYEFCYYDMLKNCVQEVSEMEVHEAHLSKAS